MINEERMIFLKSIMLVINMLIIGFILVFVIKVTDQICLYDTARAFLDSVISISANPGKMAKYTVLLALFLTITFVAREWIFPDKKGAIYSTLVFDFFMCILLMFVLDFNYNGIILWVFANVLYHVREKGKYLLLVVAILVYACTDFQLLTINYGLFSVKSYIQYFDANKNQYYLGIFNLLISVNIIFFIVFCVMVIQRQRGIITEVNALYGKLSDTNEELQSANAELKKYADLKEKMGQTKERNRLAREIHDTLGHTLTGISAGIDACIATIDVAPEMTKQQLNTLAQVSRTGISEVRRSVNELRPDALERLSLKSALEQMIEECRQVTKAQILFECEIGQLKFDEDEETTIFRIVQESITNAIRHGKASKVRILIYQELGNVCLSIKDNGIGCIDVKKGFGTKHMQERVSMLNGKISFQGEDGFLVEAVIPIRWGEEYD